MKAQARSLLASFFGTSATTACQDPTQDSLFCNPQDYRVLHSQKHDLGHQRLMRTHLIDNAVPFADLKGIPADLKAQARSLLQVSISGCFCVWC